MPDPDIFISYNREDAAVAQVFRDALAHEGFEVWWDATLRSGETYDEVTEGALRAAKAVIVLWSPRSVVSRWVRAEASIADDNKTLIPAKIEACDLPVMFRLTQTADLTRWQGGVDDKAWQAFLGDVGRMVGRDVGPGAVAAGPELAVASGVPGVPQVGVLPFTLRGDDGELEFLAEDLTEDVTRAFAENDYFKVIAAGTMAAWRRKGHDYKAIGRELDARYLAEGKLQRAGDSIRLTMQLIDTETSNAVWSHRFSASAVEIAEHPDDFPRIVATEAAEQVMQAETRRALAKRGACTGWEHVLRAVAMRSVHGTGSVERTVKEARRAVAVAPGLALAHAELAQSLMIQGAVTGAGHSEEARREIREHVSRALQLDGNNGAVLHQVIVASIVLSDGETCLRLARRLVAMRPASARSYHSLATSFLALGRTTDAIEALQAQLCCVGLDSSRSIALYLLALCNLAENRLEAARDFAAQGIAHNPQSVLLLRIKAIVEASLGNEAASITSIRQIIEIEPEMTLEQHVNSLIINPAVAPRVEEHLGPFCRLWAQAEPAP